MALFSLLEDLSNKSVMFDLLLYPDWSGIILKMLEKRIKITL